MDKIKIGISACLLGERVRYDGGHKHNSYITDTLGQYFEWVPVCPEVECGLPVPREVMRLIGDAANPRLVTMHTGIDETARITAWSEVRLNQLAQEGLCGFIFKNRSPSCSMQDIFIHVENGEPSGTSIGIFAAAFMKRFPLIPAEDEDRLNDPNIREHFFEKIRAFRKHQQFLNSAPR